MIEKQVEEELCQLRKTFKKQMERIFEKVSNVDTMKIILRKFKDVRSCNLFTAGKQQLYHRGT